jgi:hypothetical protein
MRELRLWAAAAPVVAAGFFALAALRRRRSLHPAGIGYQGWLQVPLESPPRPGVPLFQAGATHPALIRFSRGSRLARATTRRPRRGHQATRRPRSRRRPGPAVDQLDRPARFLRRLLFPATSFLRGTFSTALPYDFGSERVVLLLVPGRVGIRQSAGTGSHRPAGGGLAELRAATADGLSFELRTARPFGRSEPLATVTVGPSLPAGQAEALRFNLWTTGPGIRPSGWLNLLRDTAYRAS